MRNAITYTVIDVECTGAKVDKYAFAEVREPWVACCVCVGIARLRAVSLHVLYAMQHV